jgi:hypothetical protein
MVGIGAGGGCKEGWSGLGRLAGCLGRFPHLAHPRRLIYQLTCGAPALSRGDPKKKRPARDGLQASAHARADHHTSCQQPPAIQPARAQTDVGHHRRVQVGAEPVGSYLPRKSSTRRGLVPADSCELALRTPWSRVARYQYDFCYEVLCSDDVLSRRGPRVPRRRAECIAQCHV